MLRRIDQPTAEFTASQHGMLFLFVNDALVPVPGLTNYFYEGNRGTAAVMVTVVPSAMPD